VTVSLQTDIKVVH